jgi:hypothetical protein
MNCPTGFLWYQKEENRFLLNESQTPDGWAPLPVSVHPKDLSKEDLEALAESISRGSQYTIHVDKNCPYASDAKDNRGNSRFRPFRSIERALIEAARRSFVVGNTASGGADITQRISIHVAAGEYEVENGYGGQIFQSDFDQRQDAAKLLIANRDYLVEVAYTSYQSDPLFAQVLTEAEVLACKRDLSFFVDAVAKDIADTGNFFMVQAARTLFTTPGAFIPAYSSSPKRQSTLEAIRVLREVSRVVIKNQAEESKGGIRLRHITPDPTSLTNPYQEIQLVSDSLYDILIDTLSGSVDPFALEVNPGSDTANFPNEGEPDDRTLRAYNSVYTPGIILPRGVSIIGSDLRKVIIRPKYVPAAHDTTVGRSAIFRMTGGNFISGLTIMDKSGLSESHHKLSCFEFCTNGDLVSYYNKVALAFQDSSKFNRLQDAAGLIKANISWIQKKTFKSFVAETSNQKKYLNIFEAEIPGLLAAIAINCTKFGNEAVLDFADRFKRYHIDPIEDQAALDNALVFYSSLFSQLELYLRKAVTNEANPAEGGYIDERIKTDAASPSNPCQDVQSIINTFIDIILNTLRGATIPRVGFFPWTVFDVGPTASENQIVGAAGQNPIEGASPYVYSVTLRSRWGMCGIDGDGSIVTGLKSFLAAQFTVISMQSDTRCFTALDVLGEVEKRYIGTRAADASDYRHFGYRATNGAYAQLVSCFCIAPAIHFWTASGGEMSITNSTSNFGDVALYAEGFLKNGEGGGAYPQDQGHRLLGIKKPKAVSLIERIFVLGYLKAGGTTVDPSDSAKGTITITGEANTHGYNITNPEYPTRIYARVSGGVVAAEVISHSLNSNNETVFEVKYIDNYALNWVASEYDVNYRRGLIGSAIYFERYVDVRSYEDTLYHLIIEKAQSSTEKRREPVSKYILRLSSVASALDQPFRSMWDPTRGRAPLYFINSATETTAIQPFEGKTNYELTPLSAYSNIERQMESIEDAYVTASLDTMLDRDPRHGVVVDRADNVTRIAVEHILELLGLSTYISSLSLSTNNVISFTPSDRKLVDFNKPSLIRCSGHTWEYVGYYNYDTAIPSVQPKQLGEGLSAVRREQMRFSKLQTQVDGGRIYATGMDEEGNLYAGSRVTDLKNGNQRRVNLGTTPEVDEMFPTDFDILRVRLLYAGDVFVSGDLTVGGTIYCTNLIASDLVRGYTGEFDILKTRGDCITLNSDALEANNDWLFRLCRSLLQTQNITITFPPNNGLPGQTLITDGTGVLSWGDVSNVPEGYIAFPGISPLIPINVLPRETPGWNNGAMNLTSNGCLEISVNAAEGPYSLGPVAIENGDSLWVNWAPGVSCAGAAHNTPIVGEIISDGNHKVDGLLLLDKLPYTFTFNNLGDQVRSSVVTSNIVTLGGINAHTQLWATGANTSSLEVKINGGDWTPLPNDGETVLDILLIASGSTLQLRMTNSSSYATATNVDIAVGDRALNQYVPASWTSTTQQELINGPAITKQPVSQTVVEGQSATFTIEATGTDITYQWRRDNQNIAGATADSYTVFDATLDSAAAYTCTVSNVAGSVTSSSATLTVTLRAPVITSHPQSAFVVEGDPASFNVAATGTNLSYQWQKNSVNISGATATSYSITETTRLDQASYRVIVSNSGGAVTSLGANLTVEPALPDPPVIVQHPQSLSLAEGTNATFSVVATGSNLNYQWQKNSSNISGATNSTLDIYSIDTGDAANYRVVVSNTGGSVTSNQASLSVTLAAPVITQQPQSISINEGQSATFTVVAVGASLTYQWQRNNTPISGATSSSYTISNATTSSAANYRVVVTNAGGAVTSNNATLTVTIPAPVITQHPVSQNVELGNSATFSVTATGAALTYQWQKDGANISGATSSSYSIPSTTNGNSGSYRVRVQNSGGSVFSNYAELSVYEAYIPLRIVTQPQDVSGDPNTLVTLSVVVADGDQPYSYKWYKVGSSTVLGTQPSFSVSITPQNVGEYQCRIVDYYQQGNVLTRRAVVSVTPRLKPEVLYSGPSVIYSDLNTVNTIGFAVYDESPGGSGPYTAQLRRVTTTLPYPIIATSVDTGLLTFTTQSAHYGQTFQIVVTSAWGDSNVFIPTFRLEPPLPTITQQPADIEAYYGGTATFNVVATGSNLSYQWLKGTTPIAGKTSPTLSLSNLEADDAAFYQVRVSNPYGEVVSRSAKLTLVYGPPIVLTLITNKSLQIGSGALIQVSISALGQQPLSYQWYENLNTTTANDTSKYVASTQIYAPTLVPSATSTGGPRSPVYYLVDVPSDRAYRCKVSNSLGTAWSDPIFLDVYT